MGVGGKGVSAGKKRAGTMVSPAGFEPATY